MGVIINLKLNEISIQSQPTLKFILLYNIEFDARRDEVQSHHIIYHFSCGWRYTVVNYKNSS